MLLLYLYLYPCIALQFHIQSFGLRWNFYRQVDLLSSSRFEKTMVEEATRNV